VGVEGVGVLERGREEERAGGRGGWEGREKGVSGGHGGARRPCEESEKDEEEVTRVSSSRRSRVEEVCSGSTTEEGRASRGER
jgi:hypothetical protein